MKRPRFTISDKKLYYLHNIQYIDIKCKEFKYLGNSSQSVVLNFIFEFSTSKYIINSTFYL